MSNKHTVNGDSIYRLMQHQPHLNSFRKIAQLTGLSPQTIANYSRSTRECPWIACEENLQLLCKASNLPLGFFTLSIAVQEDKSISLHRTEWELKFEWNEPTIHVGMFYHRNRSLHFDSPLTKLYLSGKIANSGRNWMHGDISAKRNGATQIELASFFVSINEDVMQGRAVGKTIDNEIVTLSIQGRLRNRPRI